MNVWHANKGGRGRAMTIASAVGAAGIVAAVGPMTIGSASATTPSVVAGDFCTAPSATTDALQPSGVLWDGTGGFYVSVTDAVHSEICHVSASGAVTPYAGNGTPGYLPAPYGDNVAATTAEVYNPYGMALVNGTFYVADSWNGRIRAVDSTGVMTTFSGGAGSPLNRPMSVAPDGSGGLYVADSQANQVFDVNSAGAATVVAGTGAAGYGGDGGSAAQAQLNGPTSVAVGPDGSLYVADSKNNRIRRISAGVISTVAGTGQAGFAGNGTAASSSQLNDPTGLAVDAAGDLFFADANNARVREISTAGVITTVAGTGVSGYSGDGGAATNAQLSWPVGVAVDPTGKLLVADEGTDRRVREIVNGVISTVAGNGSIGLSGDGGSAAVASISEPTAVAVGNAGTYVADSQIPAIRLINSAGTISTVVAPTAGLKFPTALLLDGAGDLFIADWNNKVFELAANGTFRVLAGTGTSGYSGDGGPATNATLHSPSGLALDASGNLYIADSGNNVIRRITTRGIISTYAGNSYATSSTHPLGDGGSARNATFNDPAAIVMSSSGLLVADRDNQRIRLVSNAGTVSTFAGDGQLGWTPNGNAASATAWNFPDGLAVDAAGNILVSDDGNCVVREISAANQTVKTVAGWDPARGVTPTCGFIGADGSQMINHPLGLAVTTAGNFLVADSLNNRVRQFSY